MMRISSVQYSIMLNGYEVGLVIPYWIFRQGNPLSLYLFILYAKGLSYLFQRAKAWGNLHDIFVCRSIRVYL